jgi:hypothetical protein
MPAQASSPAPLFISECVSVRGNSHCYFHPLIFYHSTTTLTSLPVIRDLLELKQIRQSLPRAQQPPETASYFPPVLSQVPVNLVPLLPESPAASTPASPPILSPTPQSPHPPEPTVEPPSPPATPPPPPPPRRFNMSFLPLLDASAPAASPPPSSTTGTTPSIFSLMPPTPTLPGSPAEGAKSGSDPREASASDSEEKPPGKPNHLPTPDASPLRVPSPLGTPDSVTNDFMALALDGFPDPPQALPRQGSCSSAQSGSTLSPSPAPSTPHSQTPSPDSHPSLHSYFLVRPNLPHHIPTDGPGIPDSPFVDPERTQPSSSYFSQPKPHAMHAHARAQLKTYLSGIPSPTLVPPSPLSLDPESVGGAAAAIKRQSSLRQMQAAPPPPPPPRKPRRRMQMIEVNGMLIPVGEDEDEDEDEADTPAAGPDPAGLALASPTLVPPLASPPRVPAVPLA